MSELEFTFAAMATDYWKLLRSYEKVAATAPPESANRLLAQARFASSRLAVHLGNAGMELETFDGQEITPEIPVLAINAEECTNFERTVIASTVEPALLMGGRVLLHARVIGAEGDE